MNEIIVWCTLIICVTAYKLYALRNKCHHDWKNIAYNDINDGYVKIGGRYHLQCKKCGDITTRKV